MLSDLARTRPSRSPSHPNRTPPVAAPIRNPAMVRPFHMSTTLFCSGVSVPAYPSRSMSAGRETTGNSPISKPSNSQPSSAASSASHRPRARVEVPMSLFLRQVFVEPVRDRGKRLVHVLPLPVTALFVDDQPARNVVLLQLRD